MIDFLKKISPTHEPFVYVFLLLAAYQLFIQKQPLDENLLQYLGELAVALGGRQIVKPLAKFPRQEDSNG